MTDSVGVWRSGHPAGSPALERVRGFCPGMPAAYIDFVAAEDGSEGELGVEPYWIQLWRAEEVPELNAAYEVEARLPGFIAFGSSGGGELMVFDTRVVPWRICMVPCIPTDPGEAVVIAPEFAMLRRQFGRSDPAA